MKIEFPKSEKIAVAVSGGVDSMVLLSLFLEAGKKPAVVTVDHGIRGDESAEDVRFVREFCEKHGLTCFSYAVDVPEMQKKSGYSTELQARVLRYEIFDKLLSDGVVDSIALAHHLSDQTETVIMRMMRGTGIGGLCAITDRKGYIHPLLHTTRSEIEIYAMRNSVPFREDKTNLWDGHTRNFVRNRILPVIRQRCPSFERQTEKLVDSAVETEDFMNAYLVKAERYFDGLRFADGVFLLHNAILKRSVLLALKQIGVMQDVEEKALNAICELKEKLSAAQVNIGNNLIARREYETLIIEPEYQEEFYKSTFSVSKLYIYGAKYVFKLTTEMLPGVTMDLQKIPKGSLVRTRMDGDVFKRFGGKTKSLSDYFTDLKWTKHEREKALVLANGSDVLAVLGHEISDTVKVDENTLQMIRIIKENE